MEERKLLEFLERLLAVVISDHGRKACGCAYKIDPRSFFAQLDSSGLSKIRTFLEKRMPRVLKQTER